MPLPRSVRHVWVGSGILLAVGLAAYFVFTQWIVPAPFYLRYDPEMPYFTNSLLPFQGLPYAYYDHPGTPVEMLGTFFHWITRLFIPGSSEQFVLYHLNHPEIFLGFARTFLFLASLVTFYWLARRGVRVINAGDALVATAVAGVFFSVHAQSFLSTAWWSHNSFNYSFGTLLLLAAYVRFRDRGRPGWWSAVGLGAAAGVLTAVTVYMATWVIGLACAFAFYGIFSRQPVREWLGKSLTVGAASLVSFVVVNLPIYAQWPAFLKWIEGLATHTDQYGRGYVGFPSLAELGNRGVVFLKDFPLLFVFLLVAVVFFALGRLKKVDMPNSRSASSAFFLAMLIQEAAAILLVLKHPGDIYLLSAMAVLPLFLAAGYDAWREQTVVPLVVKSGLYLIVLAGFLFYGSQAVRTHLADRDAILTTNAAVEEQLGRISRDLGKPVAALKILETYGVYSKCNALWFGNIYARLALTANIGQICANTGSLNIFQRSVYTEAGALGLADSEWDVIVTREEFLTTFPFISEAGTVRNPGCCPSGERISPVDVDY